MRSKLLNDAAERTYALMFDIGEEPLSGITRFAEAHRLSASRITAIGALSEVVLGLFDWEKKDYERISSGSRSRCSRWWATSRCTTASRKCTRTW